MENKLIKFESREYMGGGAFCYRKATLKKDIGELKKGRSFQSVNIDYDNCFIQLFDGPETDELFQYNIRIKVEK